MGADILVTVRTQEAAQIVRQCLTGFLAERGLAFSEEKTKVCSVTEGFTFLSRTYVKKDGLVYSYPYPPHNPPSSKAAEEVRE